MFSRPNFFGRQKPKSQLLQALKPFKQAFITTGIVSAIINIIMIVPSIYMLEVYDRILVSKSVPTLILISLMVLGFYAFMGVLEWLRSQLLIRISNNMDAQLNEKVFSVAFSNALYANTGNPSQAFSDFTNIRQFLTGSGVLAFFDIPWTPIYIIILFMIHTVIGILAIVASLVMMGMAILTEVVTKKGLGEANKHYQESQVFANVNFRNAEAIYAMGMKENVKKHWYSRYINFLSYQSDTSSKAGTISATTKALRITFQSLLGYGVSAYYAIQGQLTMGMIVASAILIGRALSPVDLAISVWRQFVSVRESYARLEAMFAQYPEKPKGLQLPPPVGRVSVSNLIAVPPGSNLMILKNVSFEVNPGEMVGIIGPVASGKTTLGKMLVGIWPPYSGSVRLDGAEISTWDREDLGKYIGYLPQDVELLDGTVAENIARFGEIDSNKVIKAAQMAGIHEMILQFPEGYDTKLGTKGAIISGGQKQRIGLARALYNDPTLIVLDEPNSSLDDMGERALIYALLNLKKMKKTVFLITHRTPILAITDKIILMLNGSLQAFGPSQEILKALQAVNEQQAQMQAQQNAHLNNPNQAPQTPQKGA
ncbi:MAG: type I secretion system permease/ATPase [Desulfurella sp.]|uniref:type I secretion system permease/ATPase n=1 Tax=Desulfurella sp. TaxID=1962857 RepID=UPI000CB48772|nr:type I secretion system permease/ATPase [Desulfurella sp.]PMP91991.1 MAG: type I secretion system permease/ATPase [Desulfurella sp.]